MRKILSWLKKYAMALIAIFFAALFYGRLWLDTKGPDWYNHCADLVVCVCAILLVELQLHEAQKKKDEFSSVYGVFKVSVIVVPLVACFVAIHCIGNTFQDVLDYLNIYSAYLGVVASFWFLYKPTVTVETKTEIVSSFGKSLYDSWSDTLIDGAEMGVDQIIEDPVLKEVPIVKYFVAAGKTTIAIRDHFFIKKTIKFIEEFRKGTVNEAEIIRRKTALQANESWIKREIEFLILTMERIDREEKAKVIKELYVEYLNKGISKLQFEDYCSITERLFLQDIIQIRADFQYQQEMKWYQDNAPTENYVIVGPIPYTELQGRLLALGLLKVKAHLQKNLSTDQNLIEYEVSSKGQKFAEILSRVDFLGITEDMLRQ